MDLYYIFTIKADKLNCTEQFCGLKYFNHLNKKYLAVTENVEK